MSDFTGERQYTYRPVWRMGLFLMPLLLLLLYNMNSAKIELLQQQLHSEHLFVRHDVVMLLLAMLLVVPYLAMAYTLSARFIISDGGITKKTFLKTQMIRWTDLFEYRDLLYQFELVPVQARQTINVDTYANIADIQCFNRDLVLHCKEHEVNMLVKPMTRQLVWLQLHPLVVLLFMVVAGVCVLLLPYDAVFIGAVAGVVYVFLSYWITLIRRRFDRDAEPYLILHRALYLVLWLVPLLVIAMPLWAGTSRLFLAYAIGSYSLGYLAASCAMTMMIGEREDADEGRRLVTLGQ